MTRTELFDHTAAGFTANGSPTLVDDQHSPASAYDYDDVDDWLFTTAIPIGDAVAGYTVMMWHNPTDGSVGVFGQRPTSYTGTATVYDFSVQSSNRSISVAHRENNNGKYITSVSSISSFVFGSYQLFGFTVDLVTRDLNIYVNGVEVSYSTQDANSGSPSAVTDSMTRLSIGSLLNDSYVGGAKGIISRGIFEETVLTPSQMLAEYNAEVALIGSGFVQPSSNFDFSLYD